MKWLRLLPFYESEAPVYIDSDDIKSWTQDRSGRGSIVRHKSGGYTLTLSGPEWIAEAIRNIDEHGLAP